MLFGLPCCAYPRIARAFQEGYGEWLWTRGCGRCSRSLLLQRRAINEWRRLLHVHQCGTGNTSAEKRSLTFLVLWERGRERVRSLALLLLSQPPLPQAPPTRMTRFLFCSVANHKTAALLSFLAAMVASLSSGTLFALTPGVWEASATILNDTDTGHLQHAYAVGVGGFFCGVSPVLLTNSTPMLLSLAASVLVALGWMLLFLSAVHTLAWVQWPLAGLFYLFVGVGSYTAIICACTTVSLNAPRGNRGTMIGAVVAAVGVGSLLWAGLDLGAFEKCFPCYLRALAIAAPLFMLVASVFLRRVERHEEDSAAAEALRSSPLQSAEDAFINDDMISQDQGLLLLFFFCVFARS